jgi:hypothetical protein
MGNAPGGLWYVPIRRNEVIHVNNLIDELPKRELTEIGEHVAANGIG